MSYFPPTDNLITPVILQLQTIVQNQVGGINTFYTSPPAGPPDNNSVLIALTSGKMDTRTIGRLRTPNKFLLLHFFLFNDIVSAYSNAYAYLWSYCNVFENYINQNLNGAAIEVNVGEYMIGQKPYAGQPYLVLGVNIEVISEMPTPTS